MAVAIKTTHATLALGESATRAVMRNDVCTVAGQCIFFFTSSRHFCLRGANLGRGRREVGYGGEVWGREDQ